MSSKQHPPMSHVCNLTFLEKEKKKKKNTLKVMFFFYLVVSMGERKRKRKKEKGTPKLVGHLFSFLFFSFLFFYYAMRSLHIYISDIGHVMYREVRGKGSEG